MRHIIGLTIKDFSFDPEISKQLKIDYVMMATITRDFERKGEEVVFYIVTMNQYITTALYRTTKTMAHKGYVEINFLTAEQSDFQKSFYLLPSKPMDIGGVYVMTVEDLDSFPEKDKLAFASAVSASCLLRNITRKEPYIQQVTERYRIPAGLEVDYYGIVQ